MSTLDSLKGFEMLKPSRSVLTPTPPKVLIEAKKKKSFRAMYHSRRDMMRIKSDSKISG